MSSNTHGLCVAFGQPSNTANISTCVLTGDIFCLSVGVFALIKENLTCPLADTNIWLSLLFYFVYNLQRL